MNDQERMTDFICSEKKMSANYDTYAGVQPQRPVGPEGVGQREGPLALPAQHGAFQLSFQHRVGHQPLRVLLTVRRERPCQT